MLWDKMGTFWTKERYSCKGDVSFHTLEAALIGEADLIYWFCTLTANSS